MLSLRHTALCDSISAVIEEMETDGTLDALKVQYIDDVIAGNDPEKVIPVYTMRSDWSEAMHFGFSYVGLIYLVMLMLPNIVWTKNLPEDYEKYVVNENKVERPGDG